MHSLQNTLIFIIITVTICNSCKITYSFSGASISPEVKTISVQYFPNLAPLVQPTLSQYFTDELKDKFQSQTNLKIVNGIGESATEKMLAIGIDSVEKLASSNVENLLKIDEFGIKKANRCIEFAKKHLERLKAREKIYSNH